MVEVEDLFARGDAGAGRERGDQLVAGDGNGADLADDDSGGEVGEFDGGLDLQAAGETRRRGWR